ncbi:hypothetical protein VHEMI04260 [[Torrubiella] hemipterigena]|uniref:Uncharacterized protein n=1 Tax=[Torrubiella] hemipterigena TaxID=1531966 RepID=A0A0A1SUU4_9HYPO|nr:hypothetical protein VHEMI04260 [[Torrubiella] hemipterigena]
MASDNNVRVTFKGSESRSSSPQEPGSPKKKFQIDAARHTPSEAAQFLGPPTVEHGYPQDSKHRRHSMTEQERHMLR